MTNLKARILLPQKIAQTGIDFLLQQGYEVRLGSDYSEAVVAREIRDCDALLVRATPVTEQVLANANRLKIVARFGVGYDNVDLTAAAKRKIYVTNTPLANSNAVAEYTIFLLLACAKRYSELEPSFLAGDFQVRDRIFCHELRGKVLGIIGLGNIGSQVASMAKAAFGMKVIAYSPHLSAENQPPCVDAVKSREAVFREADYVSIHLPSTAQTKGSVGNAEFAWMQPQAWLINTARGDIVVEADLIAALENKQIAGAALDVLQQEPFDYSNPLFALPNVLITPHYAAHTVEAFDAMALQAAEEIDRVLRGKQPFWQVNRFPEEN